MGRKVVESFIFFLRDGGGNDALELHSAGVDEIAVGDELAQ